MSMNSLMLQRRLLEGEMSVASAYRNQLVSTIAEVTMMLNTVAIFVSCCSSHCDVGEIKQC